jgi:hypothetical protein
MIGRFYSNDPVDVLGHLNSTQGIQGFGRYTYVNNNPYKYTDPDGEALNTLAGGFVGGIVSLGLDFVSSGGSLSFQQAAGSFAGGFVTGAAVANGVPLPVANGLGATVGEAVTQTANAISGQEASFGKVVTSGVVGAITGLAPGLKVPGVTSGRGNAGAAFQAQLTKMANGQTQNITTTTLANGVKSGLVGGATQQVTKEITNAGVGNDVAESIDNRMGECLPANPHC